MQKPLVTPRDLHAQDIDQWKGRGVLNDAEKHLIKNILSFFANSDVLVGDNIIMAIYQHITILSADSILRLKPSKKASTLGAMPTS